MSCSRPILPSHAIATLLSRFIDGKKHPGWDCEQRKAVYLLASKQPSGCAVYMVATPEQRAELSAPTNNTHEACPASELGSKTTFEAGDMLLSEGSANSPGAKSSFLSRLQQAHDEAARLAADNGLCSRSSPQHQEAAQELFRAALVTKLMLVAEIYRIPWSTVESTRSKILAYAQIWAREKLGGSEPQKALADLAMPTTLEHEHEQVPVHLPATSR